MRAAVVLAGLLATTGMALAQTPTPELNARVFAAIDKEDVPALQAAFRAGASPDARDEHGDAVVVLAAKQGNGRICQVVVDAGANINVSRGGSMGALSWAVFNRQTECVQVFLRQKPDLNIRDGAGRTPLFEAEANNDLGMLKLLVEAGADLQATDRSGFTVLGDASQRNRYETVAYLRSVGARFGSDTEELFAAASGDAVRLREMLEAHRGDPNAVSLYGGNALTLAAQKGNTVAVRLLIEHAAALNVTDNNRQTALYYAVVSGHLSTVEALLDAGANVFLKAPGERSLLMTQAGWLDDAGLTRRLVAAGLAVNEPDSYGVTPLIAATQTLKLENVRALLQSGADPSLPDGKGKTALDYAQQRHDSALVALLTRPR